MSFTFRNTDFKLCDGKKSHAKILRGRFLELYNELTPELGKDADLNRFVVRRHRIYNGLDTKSPYVPQYQRRRGGYKTESWVGFADPKYPDPRVGIQFQFGIEKKGSAFYGIWVQGDNVTRPTEHALLRVLKADAPKAIASTLQQLGSNFRLWVMRNEDDKEVVNERLDRITEKHISSFVANLEKKRLWIHLGKSLGIPKLCSITVVENILKTTRRLLPVYLWWAGLAPREISEDEAYEILKSEDETHIQEIFGDPTGERKAVVPQRIGQNVMRRDALERYENQCALCDIKDSELLVASHIMRWTEDKKNRGNRRNVVCLCVVHDKMFEKCLLSINAAFGIEFARGCIESSQGSTMLSAILHKTRRKLRLPIRDEPDPKFLRQLKTRCNQATLRTRI